MKSNCSLAEIAAALKAHQRFVIMSHVRPDGDALGCEIAMGLCLKQLGKDVTVWNQDGMLEKYSFLPHSEIVEIPPAPAGGPISDSAKMVRTKSPVTVRALAERMGIDPFKLIHDLMEMNIFATVETPIEAEAAARLCVKHGCVFENASDDRPKAPVDFDVVIALDTAAQERVGSSMAALGNVKLWINIDHHISNNHYGDLAYIDPTAPATGQILYELISGQGLPFDKDIAANLFVAISTDTGSFQYPNTTARTFEIGAELVKYGVNVGRLSQQMYESYPRRRIELLRELLNVLKLTCDGHVASFTLTQEMARKVGAVPEDNEGLIDTIRAINGVIVAAFIEELGDNKVRISLRSKDPAVDVCKICAQFGGGGHTLAAGARVQGAIAEVEQKVLTAICNEITH